VTDSHDGSSLIQMAWVDKIVTIYSWDPACLEGIRRMAGSPEVYRQNMDAMEGCARDSTDECPPGDIDHRLIDQVTLALFKGIVVRSEPLLELFRAEPKLSDAPPWLVEAAAQFADLKPHPSTLLLTTDGAFMRILAALRAGAARTKDLVQEDMEKLIRLQATYAQVTKGLRQLAQWDEQWPTIIRRIEAAIDPEIRGHGGDVATNDAIVINKSLGRAAAALVAWAKTLPGDAGDVELRELLLEGPRPSYMHRQELLAFSQLRKMPAAGDLLSKEFHPAPSHRQKFRRQAAWAAEKVLDGKYGPDIVRWYELRARTAEHLLKLREFVKVDALFHRWPELARDLLADRPALIALESQVIDPHPLPLSLQQRWERYRSDDRLVRFLGMRPLFRDIYPADLADYLQAAQATPSGPDAAAVHPPFQSPMAGIPAPAGTPGTGAPAIGPPVAWMPGAGTSTQPILIESQPSYVDLILSVQPTGTLPVEAKGGLSTPMPEPQRDTMEYDVSLLQPEHPDQQVQERITLRPPEVAEVLTLLSSFNRTVGYMTPQSRALGAVVAAGRSPDFGDVLRDVGLRMFEWFFTGRVRTRFIELLGGSGDFRVLLKADQAELMTLPWETLYVPAPVRTFLALTQKYSVVRLIPKVRVLARSPLATPLRLLIVLSNPVDTSPLLIEQEEEVLTRALADAVRNGRVQVKWLKRKDATLERLQDVLRTFQPHVFHFVGHGIFDEDRKHGALVLETEEGRGRIAPAQLIATLLTDSGVQIAVFNSCHSGTASTTDIMTGVAGALVNAGVPAVVATMREVVDPAALLFSRELYRSLVEGYGLEPALAEARKAISLEQWDWSPYALFTSTTDLDMFRLPLDISHRQVARPQGGLSTTSPDDGRGTAPLRS
jgi:hypothetical protein